MWWRSQSQTFLQKSKIEHIFRWTTVWSSINLFLFYAQVEVHQKINKTNVLITCSGTSLPASFSSWILKKNIFILYSINWPNLIAWLRSLLDTLGNMYIVIIYWAVCDVINIEISLSFLIKSFSSMSKGQDKNINILRIKRVFNIK